MYFDSQHEGFILEQEGESWQKRFARLAEAVDYACLQLQGQEGRLVLLDAAGQRISDVVL